MRDADKNIQRRVALALAHLCSPDDERTIFIDNNGISSYIYSVVQIPSVLMHLRGRLFYILLFYQCRIGVAVGSSWVYKFKAAARWFCGPLQVG